LSHFSITPLTIGYISSPRDMKSQYIELIPLDFEANINFEKLLFGVHSLVLYTKVLRTSVGASSPPHPILELKLPVSRTSPCREIDASLIVGVLTTSK